MPEENSDDLRDPLPDSGRLHQSTRAAASVTIRGSSAVSCFPLRDLASPGEPFFS